MYKFSILKTSKFIVTRLDIHRFILFFYTKVCKESVPHRTQFGLYLQLYKLTGKARDIFCCFQYEKNVNSRGLCCTNIRNFRCLTKKNCLQFVMCLCVLVLLTHTAFIIHAIKRGQTGSSIPLMQQ